MRSTSARFRSSCPLDLDSIAGTHIGPIIPNCLVMRAAIVPERDRMGAPAETARPLRLVAVIDQEPQNAFTFQERQFVDLRCEIGIDVNDLSSADRVSNDDRTRRDRRAGAKTPRALMARGQSRKVGFHPGL